MTGILKRFFAPTAKQESPEAVLDRHIREKVNHLRSLRDPFAFRCSTEDPEPRPLLSDDAIEVIATYWGMEEAARELFPGIRI